MKDDERLRAILEIENYIDKRWASLRNFDTGTPEYRSLAVQIKKAEERLKSLTKKKAS